VLVLRKESRTTKINPHEKEKKRSRQQSTEKRGRKKWDDRAVIDSKKLIRRKDHRRERTLLSGVKGERSGKIKRERRKRTRRPE